ncbi:MAG: isopeptide-forming domain-containing fimbrial protein [Anaerobutyricum hallii]|uniref:isopeptide-forming domain-containing fimbrial protein n=1 Tax=Anaerobutyricum hallii TaxID=39488 RepID=UPI002A806757|nr:isopeptide-forming domain-containing fimbrial protein [Anaerobutyricum hallii]MDY4578684.1 isopeptide-forming domain-containing fimbrial protein [Anaerobutyricum hallii]
MKEKIMKKGHLLLTLLVFVCLMGLGTIHANAATVKAKVDVKKFYGMAEQVLQEINKQRRSNGLSDLKMDANFTEAAMDIALQAQGGDASASNPDIYNNRYISKDAMEIDNIDGYDMYDDNLWKENRNGTQKVLNHIKKIGSYSYQDDDITSRVGIGIVATDMPKIVPRELNRGYFCNVTYCFVSNRTAHDNTNYKVYVNSGKTICTQMDLFINPEDTYLIINLLNNKDFYGNNAGTTVKMVVKTHIDAKKVSIETLRAHGHLVENDKKTETDIKIKNETTVTTTKADNQGTWDVDKKVTPPPTTTDSPVPSIKDPVKKVSDSDDLNWDATVKQDGEKTPGSHNRVTDVTNQWLYTLTQEIPAHTVELFHYKSFTITDAVDSCLSYDVKDITIKAGDKDYTDKFDVTKGEDNSITLTAKADVLTSDEFYGGNAGNKIVVSFPVKISADAETLKDENLGHLEIDGKKLAHLQKVSDLQKLSGFTDLVKSKDNEYVYAFLNQAKTHIDSQIKYEGQTGVKDRTTDKVQTAVETADPTIKKESSKYEWQVGDKVDIDASIP